MDDSKDPYHSAMYRPRIVLDEEEQERSANQIAYNLTLKGWFVLCVIGGPAICVTTPGIVEGLRLAGSFGLTLGLFIAGCLVQLGSIAISRAEKRMSSNAGGSPQWRIPLGGRRIAWPKDPFWLTVILDISTAVAFEAAAILVISVAFARP